jgi:uncharacterized membrane protein YbaN (DUF454 family)
MKNSLNFFIAALGCLCIILGVVGIFLPLIPTTPFLLLAAWLFARSSKRFHSWLISQPKLGPFILVWQNGGGIERHTRTRVLICLWASMCISMLIIAKIWAVVVLICTGCGVTFYIMRQPVSNKSQSSQSND